MKVQYLGYHLGEGQAGVSSDGVGSVGSDVAQASVGRWEYVVVL